MLRYYAGLYLFVTLCLPGPSGVCVCQEKLWEPDLDDVVGIRGWAIFNSIVHPLTDGTRKGVRFEERKGGALAWYPEVEFSNGVIEFDARGKNVPQMSFLGVAFHGVSERFYDAIYFRPFNFKARDSVARHHAVQYISPPEHGWKELREQHPGMYENAVQPVPDPDSWIHVRVVVEFPRVSVFVNDETRPCLVVNQLSDRRSGWVGLWVGDDSDGDFSNLRVTHSGD